MAAVEMNYQAHDRVLTLASKVFGVQARSERWLSRPSKDLANKTPLQTLETKEGEQRVEQMLIRIDEGTFA